MIFAPKTMLGRLVLVIIITPMICMFSLGFIVANEQTKTSTEAAYKEASLITAGLVSGVLSAMIESNYAGIDQIVTQVAKTSTNIDRIVVVNARGIAIVDAQKNLATNELQLVHGFTIAVPEQPLAKVSLVHNHIINWMPLMAGSQVGWVMTELSLEQIHQAIRNLIVQTVISVLISIAISSFIVLFALNGPRRRISTFIKFIANLPKAQGDQLPNNKYDTEDLKRMVALVNEASASLYQNTQQLKILQALIETSADPFFVVDVEEDFRFSFVNDAASKHYGYAKNTLLTTRIQDHYVDGYTHNINELYQINKQQQHVTYSMSHRNAKGEIIPVKVMANYLSFAGRELIGGYFRDIREDLAAEQQLLTALEKAQQAAISKGAFLTNMSHEIRTPMNGILGLTELALYQDLNPTLSDYLHKIYSSGKSLLLILNDILDFSKLEAAGMHIENRVFSLNEIISNLKNLFVISAEAKQLSLIFDVDAAVQLYLVGDALRLTQILANLISNAIKFTPLGTITLKLELKALKHKQALLAFSVKDTGIGIDAEDLNKLFMPFSQVDSSMTRRFGGTGLGLAISQSLLQLMASELKVLSQPGLGTQFSFEVLLDVSPVNSGHEPSLLEGAIPIFKPVEPSVNEPTIAGISLLVVEDNTINQKVITELLKLSGIKVVIAENGQVALDKLKQQDFAAVLMDIQMPIMDGLEATRQIRLQPAFAHLPIIALTAGVTLEEQETYKAVGMNDFLPKPLDFKRLTETIKRNLTINHTVEILVPETLLSENEKQWAALEQALPGFDLVNIKIIVSGEPELLKSFLQEFYSESKDDSSVIAKMLKLGDTQGAQRLVHTLKGLSGSLGAMQLYDASEAFNIQLKQQHLEAAHLEHWQAIFEQTMASIKALTT